MNRYQKLKLNTSASLINRVILIVSGLILPRYILTYFGSNTNGLVSSINQFLSIITFLDLGVGAVVQSALYKPLANGDREKINATLTSAKNYFRKIAYILVIYVVLLMFLYPTIINQNVDYISTIFLIFAISIGLFAQYYFGIINELLLDADQRSYIQFNVESIVVIVNLIASIFLIKQGYSIQKVKLVSSIFLVMRPIYLTYYVGKHYDIDTNVNYEEEPLKQKWNGMAQHIAYTVQNSTDVIILTLFSTLKDVSIYSVYNLVVMGIRLVIASATTNLKSYFGNVLAIETPKMVEKLFSFMEWLVHNLVIFLYGITTVLIVPFVILYTNGVDDVNYNQPLFGFLLVIANLSFSLRTPYQSLIFAAGHFKQTQLSSIIEVIINLVFSSFFVFEYGLIGVAIGTIFAMFYRTVYLAFYLRKNIIYRPLSHFIKHLLVDAINLALIVFLGNMTINYFAVESIMDWVMIALMITAISGIILLISNLIFYRNNVYRLLGRLRKNNL